MKDFWPFIIIGLSTGSIYGLTAVGLVLTYKTSGIFNFAHGAITTMSSVMFFLFFEAHAWPAWLALLDSVFIAGPLMGLLMESVARRLVHANSAYKIVATLGLFLSVQYIAPTMIRIDNGVLDLPEGAGAGRRALWLPTGSFGFAGVNIGYDQLLVMILTLFSVVALTVLLRRSRLGVQMRAVVDSPDLLDLTGANPVAVRRAAWVLGSTFAAMSGALLAPQIGLNYAALSAVVVRATGAAAAGAFTVLPLAYIGGIALGIAEAVATKQFAGQLNWVSGLPQSMPFVFLFAALLIVPKKRLSEVFRPLPIGHAVHRAWPRWFGPAGIVAVLAVLIGIPWVVNFTTNWTRILIYVILFLSLGLLAKTSGQISLGHLAFAAVGAAAMHHFAYSAGIPWGVSLLMAGLVAIPVGAIVAIPASRLSGVFLALATYAFAIALESMLYKTTGMFGLSSAGVQIPRPGIWDLASESRYYWTVLVIMMLCVGLFHLITHSRLGRLLRGLGESPLALETQGLSVNTTRVLLFCISAFFAGIAGALYAAGQIFVAGPAEFPSAQGLVLLAIVMIAPGPAPWFALIAALGYGILRSDITFAHVTEINLISILFFGFFATRMASRAYMKKGQGSLSQLVRPLLDWFAPPIIHEDEPVVVEEHAVAIEDVDAHDQVRGEGLKVTSLSVRYGALLAVDTVDLVAPAGRVTGLVGPNGAGKSTTFDACSGLVKPSTGNVYLHGQDITHMGPAGRARHGLGRTFQRVQLWNALSVHDNVALGREGGMAGANPLRQLRATRSEKAEVERAVESALTLTGITHLAKREVGGLTTGQRRLVELARCLAGPYDMLLLDEPSSGLDSHETERFGQVLKAVVQARGAGILLVEHDMTLVMEVCAYIYVLDVGKLIFEGSPAEVQASDLVRAAYLGSTEVEIAAT